MQTTGLAQAKKLTYYSRGAHRRPLVVNAFSELLPRDTFLGHPELLAMYDEFETLKERTTHYSRPARKKAGEAEAARVAYKAAKAAALGSGGDPALIEDRSEELDKEADVFRGYAQAATSQATRVGAALAPVMAAAAPHLFAQSEAVSQLTETLGDLRRVRAATELDHVTADRLVASVDALLGSIPRPSPTAPHRARTSTGPASS